MAKTGMTMLNPEALTANLRDLDAATSESTLRKAGVAGARIFLEEEKLRIPQKTGLGYKSLIIAYDKEVSVDGVLASYIVTWTKEAYYLKWIEYGSSHQAAQPFKRPAFEAKRLAAMYAVDEVLNNAIQGASGGK